MHNFEITYLRADEEIESSIKQLIESLGGKITSEETLGKKRLVYTIKKQDFAYFYTIRFSLEGKQIFALSNLVKQRPEVLRHIIVSKKIISELAPKQSKPKEKPEIKEKSEPEVKETKPVESKKTKTTAEDKPIKSQTKKVTPKLKKEKISDKKPIKDKETKERLAALDEKLDELLKD